MKKCMLIFGVGQFLLAAALLIAGMEFQKATKNSEHIEQQLAENCFKIKDATSAINESFSKSSGIVENFSAQLPKIGNGLKTAGWTINGLTHLVRKDKPGTPLVETGIIFHDSAKVLKEYNLNTAPTITAALSESSESLEMIGNTIRENKIYTASSRCVTLLCFGFCIVCVINGLAVICFAKCGF